MDDARLNHAPPPRPASRQSWVPRIILWAFACLVGLWLGAGSRTVAAGGQAPGKTSAAQTALADVFRFDILMAGREPAVKRAQPKPAPQKLFNLPETVLLAMAQRPEPVSSAMPKTLSYTHPRFQIAPPARPAGPWRVKLNVEMSHLGQNPKKLHAVLATVPGLSAADQKSIQVEVQQACEQVESLRRMQRAIRIPPPPEPPMEPSDTFAEPSGLPLMP